jgi:hypothetical protein
MRRTVITLLCTAIIVGPLSGCSWFTRLQKEHAEREQARIEAENLRMRIHIGQTQNELLKEFGAPSQVLDDGKGGKIWIYTHVDVYNTPARSVTDYNDRTHTSTTTTYEGSQQLSKTQHMYWLDPTGVVYDAHYKELPHGS